MTGKTHRREVRCVKCGSWWHHPKEPLHFTSWNEWEEEHPGKETVVCPNCGGVTGVSGETVRFTGNGGGRAGKPGKKRG